MLDQLWNGLTITSEAGGFSWSGFLLSLVCSLLLGALVALIYAYHNSYHQSFMVTLALLPAIVQMVILLVNGNLGTGVAVMGAFSLVRFRSVAGGAREIGSIFLAMAVGLATGMGYLAVAVLFVLVMGVVTVLYTLTGFGQPRPGEKELKITIPEGLDYTGIFDDLFRRYTRQWELVQVRTANLGSLYKLDYRVVLKDVTQEKAFLDELRCRNGNLEIVCGRVAGDKEAL